MCIMPKVKKCEKTFALNVDIFRKIVKYKKMLKRLFFYDIIS